MQIALGWARRHGRLFAHPTTSHRRLKNLNWNIRVFNLPAGGVKTLHANPEQNSYASLLFCIDMVENRPGVFLKQR